ncbi:hemerythrin domain-containing protein [Funiculus sociatus GB2-A5]|uniref:Hemerythrin domain-containing protein n=1 Tax=Funiculus sociatus GB2-A5 TaxID=2933946 RepID=A0ABV0JN33_9CYAN|nr:MULTISPECIES: hemerythrin domain-containing protein [unclassified Trichocoleus]MBD1907825.1 hemerythrin domain-containing protein [Trichocoleus sp. FACHB-832]MBD2064003.1 hemerythrin domain-containing protein [Trichocoleus sp. FACHB-6]
MVSTLDDTKRLAIATKLADMKALQNLLINNEEKLIQDCTDDDIRKRLQDMLESDRKNLGVIDTAIVQYGVQSELKETTQKLIEEVQKLIEGSELTLFEKVFEQELLKHKQTMTGLLIHKAAQVVGADIEAAIAPLNAVNFENRAHQEQLKGVLEILGVRELTGQDAKQGLWARVEDAVAALTGVAGSVVTRTDDEMSIRDLLRMDHTKADTLFAEILGADDPQKIQEYFGQLYKDIKVHGTAEEQVLYPAIRPYYEHTQEIYEQTDEVMEMLDEIKPLDPASSEFKAKIEQLRTATRNHINQEEKDVFALIKENFSHEQQKQMATEFKTAKSQLQDQMAAANA